MSGRSLLLLTISSVIVALGIAVHGAGPMAASSMQTQSGEKAADQNPADNAASASQGNKRSGKRGIKVRPADVTTLPAATKRYALIVGIDQYEDSDINPLGGAVRDAKSLKQALVNHCQFADDNIILMTSDTHDKALKPTRSNIIYKLSTMEGLIPPDGLLVFAFSGHGLEVDGQAFLLPMESKLSRNTLYLSDNAISVDRVKEYVNKTGVKQRILFLDACRNKLTTAKGIDVAPMADSYRKAFDFDLEHKNRTVDAFLTFYATEKGQESWEDPDTGQGYFTEAIVEALNGGRNQETLNADGEVTLAALTKYVRDSVADRTKRAGKVQVPYPVTDGYGNDLVLAKLEVKRPPAEANVAAPVSPVLTTDVHAAGEIAYWASISNKTNPELFREYLNQYPNGMYAKPAATFLKDLESPYWNSISPSTDPQAFKTYCDIYPDGRFVTNAKAAMKTVEESYWNSVAKSGDPKALNTYIALYPEGRFVNNAKDLLNPKPKPTEPEPVRAEAKPADAGTRPETNAADGQPATGTKAAISVAATDAKPDVKAAATDAPQPEVKAPVSEATGPSTKTAVSAGPPPALKPDIKAAAAEVSRPEVKAPVPVSEAAAGPNGTPAKSGPAPPDAKSIPVPGAIQSFQFNTLRMSAAGSKVENVTGRANYFAEDIDGIILRSVEIPAGTFQMGSAGAVSERPRHQVALKSFFMGEFEVSEAQWRAVAKLPKVNIDLPPDPSYFKGDDLPVTNISWEEAVEFCERLSKKTGRTYRLPSESEWEYACRAGAATAFSFGDSVSADFVNFDGEHPYGGGPEGQRRLQPVAVGSLGIANAFGLYDMHGNAVEWCSDVWHETYDQAPADGRSWDAAGDSSRRVVRGGDWTAPASRIRSASRAGVSKSGKSFSQGFRIVLNADSLKAIERK
jgi:formylglycine-generating enzyme required for sulfatase activity/uncharacterized caspase-like protein